VAKKPITPPVQSGANVATVRTSTCGDLIIRTVDPPTEGWGPRMNPTMRLYDPLTIDQRIAEEDALAKAILERFPHSVWPNKTAVLHENWTPDYLMAKAREYLAACRHGATNVAGSITLVWGCEELTFTIEAIRAMHQKRHDEKAKVSA
jgi:hypothetical protein